MTVTTAARQLMLDVLDPISQQINDDDCFRLLQSQRGGMAVVVGRPVGSDRTIFQEHSCRVVVDADLAARLDQCTLDAQSTPSGKKVLVVT